MIPTNIFQTFFSDGLLKSFQKYSHIPHEVRFNCVKNSDGASQHLFLFGMSGPKKRSSCVIPFGNSTQLLKMAQSKQWNYPLKMVICHGYVEVNQRLSLFRSALQPSLGRCVAVSQSWPRDKMCSTKARPIRMLPPITADSSERTVYESLVYAMGLYIV